jgi:ATP-binding cassette subfamily F protein 3
MRQALAVALQDFSGAMVIVSHDRHLLRVSTDTLLLVHAGTVAEFDGELDDYPNWLVGLHRERRSAANDSEKVSGKDSAADRKAQKRREAEKRTLLAPFRKLMQKYEHELEALQAEQNRLDARLTDSALYEHGDGDAVRELLAERARNQTLLDAAENRWLEACEDLEQRQRE